jgi:hypothetical protein
MTFVIHFNFYYFKCGCFAVDFILNIVVSLSFTAVVLIVSSTLPSDGHCLLCSFLSGDQDDGMLGIQHCCFLLMYLLIVTQFYSFSFVRADSSSPVGAYQQLPYHATAQMHVVFLLLWLLIQSHRLLHRTFVSYDLLNVCRCNKPLVTVQASW